MFIWSAGANLLVEQAKEAMMSSKSHRFGALWPFTSKNSIGFKDRFFIFDCERKCLKSETFFSIETETKTKHERVFSAGNETENGRSTTDLFMSVL